MPAAQDVVGSVGVRVELYRCEGLGADLDGAPDLLLGAPGERRLADCKCQREVAVGAAGILRDRLARVPLGERIEGSASNAELLR